MSFLNLKDLITNHIQGFVNRNFNEEVSSVELFQAIVEDIDNKSKKLSDEILAPNDFTIFLGDSTCGKLSSKRILDTLIEKVERKVIKDDLFMDGNLNIRIQKDKSLDESEIKVQSMFLEENKKTQNDEDHTIVLERKKFDAPLNLPKFHTLAKLTVVEGNDKDLNVELTEKVIYIGRKEKNDIVLNDDKISRIHAYISYDRHRHILVDAGSLNGSYIDDERIDRIYLNNKDLIKIGETVLRYEVI